MKKLALSLVVGAALAFTPLSSFALTAMSADTMKDATGQAGVSIALDDITLYQTVGEKMYIDGDGATLVGAVGDEDTAGLFMTGKESLITIRAVVDNSNRGGFLHTAFANVDEATPGTPHADGYARILDGTFGNRDNDADLTNANAYTDASGKSIKETIKIAALSIDVSSKCPISSKLAAAPVGGVIIGLPTIEIVRTGDTQTIGVAACDENGNYTTANANEDSTNHFIEITKERSVLTVLGGSLEIAPH